MTKEEAYKTLGITGSISTSRAEQFYKEKCKKLRFQTVPGMPAAIRQKAHAELATVNMAWQVLQTAGHTKHTATKPATPKPAVKKKAKPPSTYTIPYQKPRTLAEAWEQLFSLMPFSRPVAVIIVIAVFLLTIISLLRSL
jgi:precorrin-4 methylase